MLDKKNMDILYLIIVLFVAYVLFFGVKERLDNVSDDSDLNSLSEEELRLTINRGVRAKERFDFMSQNKELAQNEYIKKQMSKFENDMNRGVKAKDVLVARGIFV
jgi:hypothetical protein